MNAFQIRKQEAITYHSRYEKKRKENVFYKNLNKKAYPIVFAEYEDLSVNQ